MSDDQSLVCYVFGGFLLLFGSGWAVIGFVFATGLVPPDSPDVAYLAWVFLLVGLAIAAAGVALIQVGRHRRRRARELLANGTPMEATVIDLSRSMLRVNGTHRWVVRYTYRDSAGTTHEAHSPSMARKHAEAYKPGERVKIRVDPRDPGQSILVPLPASSPRT